MQFRKPSSVSTSREFLEPLPRKLANPAILPNPSSFFYSPEESIQEEPTSVAWPICVPPEKAAREGRLFQGV